MYLSLVSIQFSRGWPLNNAATLRKFHRSPAAYGIRDPVKMGTAAVAARLECPVYR